MSASPFAGFGQHLRVLRRNPLLLGLSLIHILPKTISGKIRRVEIRQNDMAKHQADKPK